MSAICGLYSVDGGPVDRTDLDRLMGVEVSPAPDVETKRSMDMVALGYRGFWTTEEHSAETQPYSDNDKTRWVVSDARIDNRGDLLQAFGTSDIESEEVSDPMLIMSAYRKWGIDCARHIVGDFAFALWDSKAKILFCARDALGVRPLFYAFDGKRFAFASFMRQLATLPNVDRSLDDDFVADFLARGDCPSERAVYRGMKPVRAGHLVVIERGMLKDITYWDFDPRKTIRYKEDAQYEEHFRGIFSNAVKVRLPAKGPVAADLSGGLDSSSIVCMAQEIYRTSQAPAKKLAVYTDIFESRKVRETKWADLVINKYMLASIRRPADPNLFASDFDPILDSWDQPTLKVLGLPEIRGKGKALSDRGIRVLLSGIGGDQALLSSVDPCHLADLLRHLHWKELLRETLRWQKCLSQPVSSVLLEYGCKPIFHPNAMWALRKSSEGLVPWIAASFERNFHVRARMLHRGGFLPRRFWSVAQQRHYLGIMRTSAALVEGPMMKAPVEIRYPYLDRQLTEFALAIPLEQKIRPEETRSILRRSLRGILPEPIRIRKSKGWFGEAIFLKLARERLRLDKWVRTSRAAAYGYIDPVEFSRALDRAFVGFSQNGYLFMAALAFEIWLRGNEFSDTKWQLVSAKQRGGDRVWNVNARPLARQKQNATERKEVL